MSERRKKRVDLLMRFAHDLATMSTCKRLSVGCVVTTPDLDQILSMGYNGPPHGVGNDSCRNVTPCGCVHSEANALVKLKSDRRDLVLFVTDSPCEHCAGLIINSRAIDRVVYDRAYRDRSGLILLEGCGVSVNCANPRLLNSKEVESAPCQDKP